MLITAHRGPYTNYQVQNIRHPRIYDSDRVIFKLLMEYLSL